MTILRYLPDPQQSVAPLEAQIRKCNKMRRCDHAFNSESDIDHDVMIGGNPQQELENLLKSPVFYFGVLSIFEIYLLAPK